MATQRNSFGLRNTRTIIIQLNSHPYMRTFRLINEVPWIYSLNIFYVQWCHGVSFSIFEFFNVIRQVIPLHHLLQNVPINKKPKLINWDSRQVTILDHLFQSADLHLKFNQTVVAEFEPVGAKFIDKMQYVEENQQEEVPERTVCCMNRTV